MGEDKQINLTIEGGLLAMERKQCGALKGWQRQILDGIRGSLQSPSVMLTKDVLLLEPIEARLGSHGSVDHKC